eukprot:m.127913 g.127913  ORF g.127913 m.127913 type:complete len:320 (+) comp52279_c0_seq2:155-1114(+)
MAVKAARRVSSFVPSSRRAPRAPRVTFRHYDEEFRFTVIYDFSNRRLALADVAAVIIQRTYRGHHVRKCIADHVGIQGTITLVRIRSSILARRQSKPTEFDRVHWRVEMTEKLKAAEMAKQALAAQESAVGAPGLALLAQSAILPPPAEPRRTHLLRVLVVSRLAECGDQLLANLRPDGVVGYRDGSASWPEFLTRLRSTVQAHTPNGRALSIALVPHLSESDSLVMFQGGILSTTALQDPQILQVWADVGKLLSPCLDGSAVHFFPNQTFHDEQAGGVRLLTELAEHVRRPVCAPHCRSAEAARIRNFYLRANTDIWR